MKQLSLTTTGLVFSAMLGLAWQQALFAQSTATGQPKGAMSPASTPSGSSYTTQKNISGFPPPPNQMANHPAIANQPAASKASAPTKPASK